MNLLTIKKRNTANLILQSLQTASIIACIVLWDTGIIKVLARLVIVLYSIGVVLSSYFFFKNSSNSMELEDERDNIILGKAAVKTLRIFPLIFLSISLIMIILVSKEIMDIKTCLLLPLLSISVLSIINSAFYLYLDSGKDMEYY